MTIVYYYYFCLCLNHFFEHTFTHLKNKLRLNSNFEAYIHKCTLCCRPPSISSDIHFPNMEFLETQQIRVIYVLDIYSNTTILALVI